MLSKQCQGQDIQKYRKRLNELYQQRKDIVGNIKTLVRRKRFLNQSMRQQGQRAIKVVKNNDSNNQIKSQESIVEHQPHLNTQEEEIKKIIQIQSNIKDRNKRLFGGLNGYLKKAETILKQEEGKTRSKMQVQQHALNKEREQALQLQQQKRKELQQNLQKLVEQKKRNSVELLKTENDILKNKFIAYVSDLQQSLPTSNLPVIHWKPACNNQSTTRLYQQHKSNLEKQAIHVIDEIINYNQKFDYTRYTLQNEREYYNHMLDNYFKSKMQFITTKTSPSLLWQPSEFGKDKVEEARKESSVKLIEEASKRKSENDPFYHRFQKQVLGEQQIEQESESGQ